MGRNASAVQHALSNDFTHAVHLNNFIACTNRCGYQGNGSPAACGGSSTRLPVFYITEDVFFCHTPFLAGTGNGFKFCNRDFFFFRNIFNERRIKAPCCPEVSRCMRNATAIGSENGRGFCRSRRRNGFGIASTLSCRCRRSWISDFAIRRNEGNRAPHFYNLAFLGEDFFQDSGMHGRYFRVYFICSYFQDRFILFNLIARLLEPTQNGGFCNAFAHFGHDQLNQCHSFSCLKCKVSIFNTPR